MPTITVTSPGAFGPGTLADAIAKAEATQEADTIVFKAGISTVVTPDTFVITTKITIDGDLTNDGHADVRFYGSAAGTDPGTHSHFRVEPTGSLKLDGVELYGGFQEDFAPRPTAGAVLNFGTLAVVNSVFSKNHAVGGAGYDKALGEQGLDGGAAAGAIYNAGKLSVSNTVFRDNRADGGDGGAGRAGSAGGEFGGDGGVGGKGGDAASAIINAVGATMTFSSVSFDDGSAWGGNGGRGGDGGFGTLSGGDGGNGGDGAHMGGYFLNLGKASGTFIAASQAFVVDGSGGAGGSGGQGAFDGQPGSSGTYFFQPPYGATYATSGGDTVVGLSGPEYIFGLEGSDTLEGSGGDDSLFGGDGDDVLEGGSGGDYLDGGSGNDTLIVAAGDEFLEGSAGSNEADFSAITKGVAVDLSLASIQLIFGGSVRLRNITDLTGTDFNDTLAGDAGANRLDGGEGLDKLEGRAGDDTYVIDASGDVIVETAGGGLADRLLTRVSYTLAAGVDLERMATTASTATTAINLTGNSLTQEIIGNYGANVLRDGGGAADVLKGLNGNDTYQVYSSGTTIVESSAAGGGAADRVMAGVDYVLASGVGVEIMTTNGSTGTSAIDLTGNTLKQTITGNAGANILNDGGLGAGDTMAGLGGNDTYVVNNSSDVIVEGASQGTADRVTTLVDFTLKTGVFVEELVGASTKSKAAIDLVGNEIAQAIVGNSGDNRLEGRGGNDTLTGLFGKDTFVFNTAPGSGNVDTITDFNYIDDRFLMSDAVYKALTPGTLSAAAFRANTTGLAQDASDRIIYETDTGELYYDANGNASGGGVLFAKISVGLAITNADFSVA